MRRYLAGALLARLVLAGGLSAQPPQTFSEKLTVREREILVDVPDKLDGDRLHPKDFRVLVDGQPRQVTRAEPAAGEWTIVLYIDDVLAEPGTIFYSGLALANRARELTRVGSVEVAVAGPDVQVVLAPTREPRSVERTLTDLSSAARLERDRVEGRTAAGEPSVPQTRRQLDQLLAFLAARRPVGPHAVFLVADGPDLAPEQAALLEAKDSVAATAAPAFPFQRAARLLAAYGWVVIPVPLRQEGLGPEIAQQSEIELLRQGSGPGKLDNGVPPVLPGHPPKKTALAFPGVIDLFVAPKTAALRLLSRASAGTVIGFEAQLGPALAALPRRWRLWVSEPDAPVDGRLHSLAVSVADREKVRVLLLNVAELSVPGTAKVVSRQVRAPQWIRSSTPPEIAEARLADLLAHHATGGELPLTASLKRTRDGLELRIGMPPVEVPDSAPPGPVRVSWTWSGEDAAAAHHELLNGLDLRQGLQHTLRLAPPANADIAVTVEALGPESWGGAVLNAGP